MRNASTLAAASLMKQVCLHRGKDQGDVAHWGSHYRRSCAPSVNVDTAEPSTEAGKDNYRVIMDMRLENSCYRSPRVKMETLIQFSSVFLPAAPWFFPWISSQHFGLLESLNAQAKRWVLGGQAASTGFVFYPLDGSAQASAL